MAAHPRQNEPLRFDVDSSTKSGHSYLVDLEAFGCRGRCTCIWFETHCGPLMRKGEQPKKLCRHIRTAREMFADLAIRAVVRGLKDGKLTHENSNPF